jgi:hypothetical protein
MTTSTSTTTWPFSQLSNDGVTIDFTYPPSWIVSLDSSTALLDDPALSQPVSEGCDLQDPPCNAEDAPEIALNIVPNDPGVSLDAFVASFEEGWFGSYRNREELDLPVGRALVFNDIASDVPATPPLAAFVNAPGAVLVVTAHWPSEADTLRTILDSIVLR